MIKHVGRWHASFPGARAAYLYGRELKSADMYAFVRVEALSLIEGTVSAEFFEIRHHSLTSLDLT